MQLGLFTPAKKTRSGEGRTTPRPFLKWAGGKGQLLPDLLPEVARAAPRGRYHEPFVGGGALFFELRRLARLPKRVTLSDTNPNLIAVWLAVRDELPVLLDLLAVHHANHTEEYYYKVREEVPASQVERAARIIFLNKTCFNGLYRENSKGKFNVPFANNANPAIRDEANLRACSAALAGVEILNTPFSAVGERARAGELVYFDPPYVPVSKSASFTSYAKDGFDEPEQRQLAELFAELTRRGVKAILSNSDMPLVRELYDVPGCRYGTVMARRNVNRDATKRGAVAEALVCNFDETGKLLTR